MTDGDFSGPIVEFIRDKSNATYESYDIRLNGRRMAQLQLMGEWNLTVYGEFDGPTGWGGFREETFPILDDAIAEIIRITRDVVGRTIGNAVIRSCRLCGKPLDEEARP